MEINRKIKGNYLDLVLEALDETKQQNTKNFGANENIALTLRSIITNPAGKGSSYGGKRSNIIAGLNREFIMTLHQYRKDFAAKPYVFPDGRIIFKMKIPSTDHKHNKIVYDVLFELYPKKNSKQLSSYPVKVFSNSMSFIYTYAYVFNKYGFLIDGVKNNLPSQCLNQPPVVRNPVEALGFEKSLYFAARYLIDGFCLTDQYLKKYGETGNKAKEAAIYQVSDPSTLQAIYNYSKYQQAKTHKKKMSNSAKRSNEATKRHYVKSVEIQSKKLKLKKSKSSIKAKELRKKYKI